MLKTEGLIGSLEEFSHLTFKQITIFSQRLKRREDLRKLNERLNRKRKVSPVVKAGGKIRMSQGRPR